MAGTPVVTLVNLSEVYLRAFVPEGQIGRVRIGQPARVYPRFGADDAHRRLRAPHRSRRRRSRPRTRTSARTG